jgi:hypothetical protein
MTPFEEGQEERIREAVAKRLSDYIETDQDPSLFAAIIQGADARDHIINIGKNILCAKWGIGYPAGGFVQAFIDNDLMETYSRADSINLKCIRFYVILSYNQSYIS